MRQHKHSIQVGGRCEAMSGFPNITELRLQMRLFMNVFSLRIRGNFELVYEYSCDRIAVKSSNNECAFPIAFFYFRGCSPQTPLLDLFSTSFLSKVPKTPMQCLLRDKNAYLKSPPSSSKIPSKSMPIHNFRNLPQKRKTQPTNNSTQPRNHSIHIPKSNPISQTSAHQRTKR